MAGEAADMDRWKELGRLLERRRYELGSQYRSLQKFADDRGVNFRLLWDIEHARRTNYGTFTLADISQAYRLDKWSIEEFIRDGKPLAEEDANPYSRDPDLAKVWDKSRGLKPEERHGLVKIAKGMRDKGRSSGSERGDTRKRA